MGYYIIDYINNTRIEYPHNDPEVVFEVMKLLVSNRLLELGLHKYAIKVYDIITYDLQEVASNFFKKLADVGRKGKIEGEFEFPYVFYENEFMKVYYGDSEVYGDRAIIIEVYDPRSKKLLMEIHSDESQFMFKNILDSLFPKTKQKYDFLVRREK